MTQYFMNPKTGDVETADEWRKLSNNMALERFSRWAAINLIEVREPLTEYEFAVYGSWVPASVDDNKNEGEDDEHHA